LPQITQIVAEKRLRSQLEGVIRIGELVCLFNDLGANE
jgi:hypothetical protein